MIIKTTLRTALDSTLVVLCFLAALVVSTTCAAKSPCKSCKQYNNTTHTIIGNLYTLSGCSSGWSNQYACDCKGSTSGSTHHISVNGLPCP